MRSDLLAGQSIVILSLSLSLFLPLPLDAVADCAYPDFTICFDSTVVFCTLSAESMVVAGIGSEIVYSKCLSRRARVPPPTLSAGCRSACTAGSKPALLESRDLLALVSQGSQLFVPHRLICLLCV